MGSSRRSWFRGVLAVCLGLPWLGKFATANAPALPALPKRRRLVPRVPFSEGKTYTYTYDRHGRLCSVTEVPLPEPGHLDATYTYYACDHRVTDDRVTSYTYDVNNESPLG
jgi:hypothetical protein